MIEKSHGGVCLQHITKGEFEDILFPLPPLEEQVSIYKKTEQLLFLCDDLEKRLKKIQEYSEKLLEAVLKESFKA